MLNFANTQIKELPEGMNDITTDLNLNNSKIEKLPSTFTVQGNLIIGNALIKELPEDLIVTGDLDLTGSLIKEVPNSAYIGGDILGENISYNPIDLYNGRITSKVVMWKNKIMPYRKSVLVTQRQTHDYGIADSAMIYYGLSKDWNAILVYKDKWFYFFKKGDNLNPIYKDIELKKQKERIGNKYKYLKLTDMFSLKEIFPIYQDITDACDKAYDDFVRVIEMLGLSTEEKYSLETWIKGSKKADYIYNYLFTEYFENEKEAD